MNSMPEPSNNGEQINDSIVEAAITALAPFRPADRDQVADMLLFWTRRHELTDSAIAEVQERMFPRSTDFADGYAEGFLDAIQQKAALDRETQEALASVAGRREVLTAAERDALAKAVRQAASDVQPGPLDDGGFAERWLADLHRLRAEAGRSTERTASPMGDIAARPEWCVVDHAVDEISSTDDLVLHVGDDHTDGTVRKLLDAHRLAIVVARTDSLSEGTTGTPALLVRVDAELTTWEQAAELARTILDGFGYLAEAQATR